MDFELQIGDDPLDVAADALVVPHIADALPDDRLSALAEAHGLDEVAWIFSDGEFRGRRGQQTVVHCGGRATTRRMLLVGLGDPSAGLVQTLRDAMADAARSLRDMGCRRVAFLPPEPSPSLPLTEAIVAIVEAVSLGLYTFLRYKTGRVDAPEDIPLHPDPELGFLLLRAADVEACGGAQQVHRLIERGDALGRATNMTKDICNEPANVMTPRELTKEFLAVVGSGDDFTVEVLDEDNIERRGLGLVRAVARGSREPARVVLALYRGNPLDDRYWGIVGKGVTFDSGGISLKNPASLFSMKRDLTGAGSVIGVLDACRRLRPPINVAGLIVAAENMPDGAAYKPGDVYTSLSGKTVEVFSTDAEGRLLMADAMTLLQRETKLHGMLTVATLTTDALASVGPNITPLLGTSPLLARRIIEAGERAGERFWELPLEESYMPRVKSHIADLKTNSPKPPTVIAGAMFLREFVEPGIDWVHLDIAGTAVSNRPGGVISRGATGISVRTILRFLLDAADNAG